MKVKLASIKEKITSIYWFIPGLIIIAIVTSLFILKRFHVDSTNDFIQEVIFIYAEPEAVRLLLSSIATSVMTVLGVLFSIIIVVMQQMSNQYTPRVVANFTRSKIAQTVLGFFVGTFIYCLLLLMNVGNESTTGDNLPNIAISVAGLLAIICLLLLVYFIHDITQAIQSTSIISGIKNEAIEALENVIRDRRESNKSENYLNKERGFQKCIIIHADKAGYLDTIDWPRLPRKIKASEWEVVFHKSSGDFVQKEMELMTIWSNEIVDAQICMDIFNISSMRTISQDPAYGIQKLSDISLKALSPGINDPSTAIEAINSMTTVLTEFAKKYPMQDVVILDERRAIRFVTCGFEEILEKSYGPTLSFSKEHSSIRSLIKDNLYFLLEVTRDPSVKNYLKYKASSL